MYKDLFGKMRKKVALHIHTTLSDGRLTPEEVASMYKDAGFDAVALTDHRKHGIAREIDGLQIIAGAEYNTYGAACEKGLFHIVSLFAERDPEVNNGEDDVQTIIDKIHAAQGLAVLAHPAWSLNTPEMIMKLHNIDATEIYNAVSEAGQSFRPDSSLIVDMIAGMGRYYPLLATDDAHYYEGADNCRGWIMVECAGDSHNEIKQAILDKRFYATQGPEVHLTRMGDKFRVDCSPVSHIYFASNMAWCVRTAHGEGLTEAEYTPVDGDLFVRAFVVDKDGNSAWTNIIEL